MCLTETEESDDRVEQAIEQVTNSFNLLPETEDANLNQKMQVEFEDEDQVRFTASP